ncbi:MAG: hypothetical protein CVT79_05325 [Alphaproteobacteria bacterium HGW-Alphaproteobacteria-18]|nr:MAG: hypothetical protein CVT79_05325 [Alphaproteobacteria bacterium HGW-Alphaproteobacteria-18]
MSGAVTIRRCASAEEAAIVCALLNDAGIPASLENWHHAMIDWGALQALGGVGVLVPAGQFDDARRAIIEYAESAEDRLSAEFPKLEDYPLKPKRLRYYILLAYYTGLAYLPLIVIPALIAGGLRVSADAKIYGFDWSLIPLHFNWIDWLALALAQIFAAAYFLVPLSVFVFLARRFLNQRARQKQSA